MFEFGVDCGKYGEYLFSKVLKVSKELFAIWPGISWDEAGFVSFGVVEVKDDVDEEEDEEEEDEDEDEEEEDDEEDGPFNP